MLRALATINVQRRESVSSAVPAPAGGLGSAATGTLRATQFHNGIQSRPSIPVTMKADRQPFQTARAVARGVAAMIPTLTPVWFSALPSDRSAGLKYW